MTWNRLADTLAGINIETPIIIASGVWPYDLPLWSRKNLDGVGALCTKAVSYEARRGNKGMRVWETSCGMLNSIGLQNTGVSSFLNDSLPMIHEGGMPFLVNVVMENIEDTQKTLLALAERSDIVKGVELNISCPNVDGDGMAWGVHPESTAEAVAAARSVWPGSLFVKLTPQAHDPQKVARAAEDAGADALVVANTWLGMAIDINRRQPVFNRTFAGFSGPAVFPLALRLVWQVCEAVSIPVIGCGGVTTWQDALSMVLAGASAVELGTAMFVHSDIPSLICKGLNTYLIEHEVKHLRDLKGQARAQKGVF
jgi:dihydroorotate dehydrogenase (NAD+) catalytic subunit